jgi:hypothetical protein
MVPAGVESTFFSMATSRVAVDTPVTITATWRGGSVRATTTLTPQPAPTSITLDPATTSGSSGSFGRVTAADPRSEDVTFSLTSSRPDLVRVPSSVIVPQFAAAGGFHIGTVAVSERTLVTISVSGGGVTLDATLTLEPVASPAVAALALSPSTVSPGGSSTGTVTLTAAAPAGGLVVALSASSTVASVPATLTVPAGATSASFTVSTSSAAGSTTITASGGGASRSAVLTVNAPAQDTVTISRAEWNSGRLRVEASSSGSSATLSVYVTSTGAFLGTISGGRFETTIASNPGSVTVRSSLGGSATRVVTG